MHEIQLNLVHISFNQLSKQQIFNFVVETENEVINVSASKPNVIFQTISIEQIALVSGFTQLMHFI